jgi:hypothetical protein
MTNKALVENSKLAASFKPFLERLYDSIDLDRLIVYSLWRLEKINVPLYFDVVTVAAFKLFPGKFSMATFPEYPDTNRTNKAVRRLTDEKRRNWATGNVENGFYLTDLGREIAGEVEQTLNATTEGQKPAPVTRSRGRSSTDDLNEIRESDFFKQWKDGEKPNPHEFFAFLKAAPYTPKDRLVERLKQFQSLASDTKDTEIQSFLDWVFKNFHNQLNVI